MIACVFETLVEPLGILVLVTVRPGVAAAEPVVNVLE